MMRPPRTAVDEADADAERADGEAAQHDVQFLEAHREQTNAEAQRRALRISRSNLRDELEMETEKDIDLELELLELQSPSKLKKAADDRWGA